MRLLFVRHCDPDYLHDSLTEKGWKEAEMLSERMVKIPAVDYYVSPLGRAQDTANVTMKKLGREAIVKPWLREFPPKIHRPDRPDEWSICWDWVPQDFIDDERFYRRDEWFESEIMAEGDVKGAYDKVADGLDEVLAEHGYIREGNGYKAVAPNNDTIVFFCHFGVTCVMLSHLTNISPMLLWHNFCAAPSSVTTVITEERRREKAIFRVNALGDISHLYVHDEQPSFSARYCECYDNEGERRDSVSVFKEGSM